MIDPNDWRLQGQDRYLMGVDLCYRPYCQNPLNPKWDHDHCEFCSAKFMVGDDPDTQHQGFATVDDYRWICDRCFNDFQEMFHWRLIPASVKDV